MELLKYRDSQRLCSRCGSCKFIPPYRVRRAETMSVCPAVSKYNFNAFSGCGKLEVGYSINDGHSEVNESTKNIAYKCTLCGACDVTCKIHRKGIEVSENIEALRSACVEKGLIYKEHQAIIDSIMLNGNQLEKAVSERIDWSKNVKIKQVSAHQTGNVFLYVGDMSSFIPKLAQRTQKVAELLLSLGLDLVTSGKDEKTCADMAFDLGFTEVGVESGKKLLEDIKKSGATRLVTIDAHAYTAFRYYFPKNGIDLGVDVLHITELLNEQMEIGKLKMTKPIQKKITYHDPCNLGRRSEPYIGEYDGDSKRKPYSVTRTGDNGLYDAPRKLLEAIPGLELVEMDRIKSWAYCCGNGAGVADVNHDLFEFAGEERVKEAELTKADGVATACPRCEKGLSSAVEKMQSNLQVLDLLELVLESAEV